jgi:hypothetical protein
MVPIMLGLLGVKTHTLTERRDVSSPWKTLMLPVSATTQQRKPRIGR